MKRDERTGSRYGESAVVVRFTKSRHEERPHTFTCTRDDGSVSGMQSSEFFIRHDLTHFAVETHLGLTQAFYGLLSQGWEIESFEERQPGSRKVREMPAEALYTEVIVGTLDLDWAAGPLPASDSVSIITERLSGQGPSEVEIEAIRAIRGDLWARWQSLEPGESIELTF